MSLNFSTFISDIPLCLTFFGPDAFLMFTLIPQYAPYPTVPYAPDP